MQIYMPLSKKNTSTLDSLTTCLEEVKTWLAGNFLFLNSDKTEVIVFNPSETRQIYDFDLGSLGRSIDAQVQNLGVILDSSLKFDKQFDSLIRNLISAVAISSFFFFYLRSIPKILPKQSLKLAIHALINSCLDYCHLLYFSASKSQTARQQIVQNAAVRFLMGKRKFDHVTPC